MDKRRKITPEVLKALRARKHEGATIAELMVEFGLGSTTIHAYTKGITPTGPKPNQDLRDKVRQLRNDEGLTYELIAETLGITKQRVEQILNE